MSLFRRLAAVFHRNCIGCLAATDGNSANLTVEETAVLTVFTIVRLGVDTVRADLCPKHRETIEKMCREIRLDGERAS